MTRFAGPRSRPPRSAREACLAVLLAVVLPLTGCGDSGPCTVGQILGGAFSDDERGVLILENSSDDDRIVGVDFLALGTSLISRDVSIDPGDTDACALEPDFYDVTVYWADANPSRHTARIEENRCVTVHAGG